MDDDFPNLDFIYNYYYLQVSFTSKHADEMVISHSIQVNKIFNKKFRLYTEAL